MPFSCGLPSCLYRPASQTPSCAPESGCSEPTNVTHWPPSAFPLNWTTGTPFLLAATIDAEDAFRLAASKRSEEHTSELQSRLHLVCRLLLEKKKKKTS